METKKIFTAKKGRTAVIIDDRYTVVLRSDESYNVIDDISNGTLCEDQTGVEPFIVAFELWKKNKEEIIAKAAEEKRLIEEKRLNDLSELIKKCETPVELSEEFGITIVETAKHWSDLHEGRSGYAFLISDLKEYEIIQLAIDIHDAEGEWGELTHRAGEHHHSFSHFYDLKNYQEAIKTHFNGDNFFYRSQENEEFHFMEMIKDAETIDDIKSILSTYDEIIPGYYNCNGNLQISEDDLESPELMGYSYDVYGYCFGFALEHKFSWNEKEEENED